MAWPEDEPVYTPQPTDKPRTMSQLPTNLLFILLLQVVSGYILVTNFGLFALLDVAFPLSVDLFIAAVGLVLLPIGAVQILTALWMLRGRPGSVRKAVIVDLMAIPLVGLHFLTGVLFETARFLAIIISMNVLTIFLLTMTTCGQDFYDI
jgi:hypothetical protein